MSDHSNIEWTDATWNPIRGLGKNRWMCQKISPGCDNCYASTLNVRFGGQPYKAGDKIDHLLDRVLDGHPFVQLDEKSLNAPLHWKRPRRIFVCSMTDLFGEWVPDDWISKIFSVMWNAHWHQFQILTKRPKRFLELVTTIPEGWSHPPLDDFNEHNFPHVWAGVSVEENRYCWRVNVLRQIPAAVRFVSAEPLLGPLPTLRTVGRGLEGIDWLIAGGESGARHRPIDPDWVRELRDLCAVMPTAFFFKQWGGRTHAEGGRILDGRTWDEYPDEVALTGSYREVRVL